MKYWLAGLTFVLCPWQTGAQDFKQVTQLHQQGEYQQSFPLYLEQARLGYAPAQIALAQAYAAGYGSKVDYLSAYAWALMAKEQNHPMAETLYRQYRTHLTSRRAGKQLFQQLNSQYGLSALQQSLYPNIHSAAMPLAEQPQAINTPEVEYAAQVYENQEAFWLLLQFDVNENGQTENISTLAAYPDEKMKQQIAETVAKWQFKPATDSHNNPLRFDYQTRLFSLYPQHSSFTGSPQAKALFKQADEGVADAQYRLSKLIEHEIVSATYGKPLNWLTKSAINGNSKAQFELYQCLSVQSRCEQDHSKAMKWLKMAEKNGEDRAQMQLIRNAVNSQGQNNAQTQAILQGLIEKNHLPALILYAKLLATSNDPNIKDPHQAIKYARQAMALDNNHPQLLGILAVAHYDLGQSAQAQQLLSEAIGEAEFRRWPIDYYVNLLEQYQRATLLGE